MQFKFKMVSFCDDLHISISFQTRQGRRYEMVPDQIRWYHSQQRKVNFLGTNNMYGALHIVSMKVNKRCVRLMLYHF